MNSPRQYPASQPPSNLADQLIHRLQHLLLSVVVQHQLSPLTLLLTGPHAPDQLWPLIQAISQHWHDSPQPLPHWRLHLPTSTPEQTAELAGHPYLAQWFEQGHLVLGPPEPPATPSTWPLVIISLGALSQPPHQAASIQYGKRWQANTLDAPPEQWQAMETSPEDWEDVLQYYQSVLSCSDFTLPVAAAQQLSQLASQWHGNVLCLAMEPACLNLHELRQGRGSHGELNLDALARYQAQQGAFTWAQRINQQHCLYLSWLSPNGTDQLFASLTRQLDVTRLNITANLLTMARHNTAIVAETDQLPHWLAMSGYDPALLAGLPDTSLHAPDNWPEHSLQAWRDALASTWANYLPTWYSAEILLRFAQLARITTQWGLMRDALYWLSHWYQPHPDWLQALAECEAATGRLAAACHWQQQAVDITPQDNTLAATLTHYHTRHKAQQTLAPACRDHTQPLQLEPLGLHHTDALAWQYRDPHIAILTGLPPMAVDNNDNSPDTWLTEQLDTPGKRNFAIMHVHYGAIGVVAYERKEDSAYISYWIGTDYQGMGFSTPAVQLLMEQALHEGISMLYTSVYTHNQRSHHTLLNSQFHQLPIQPTAEEPLYYYARQIGQQPAHPLEQQLTLLTLLCQQLDCTLPPVNVETGQIEVLAA